MALKFIDALDDATLDAEQDTFRGGADEFHTPTKLPDEVSGRLVNCLVEDNGRPFTRFGRAYTASGAVPVVETTDPLRSLLYFDTPATERLIASGTGTLTGASIFSLDIGGAWVTTALPAGYSDVLEMAQGGAGAVAGLVYLALGTAPGSQWLSFNPATLAFIPLGFDNVSNTGDPPIGSSIMCWHAQRMFAYAPTSTVQDQIAASTIGDAGVNQWDWVSFSFRVGRGEGERITSLISGKGFWLIVGKESSIYAVNAEPGAKDLTGNVSAAAWPIRRVSAAVGIVGKRAACMFGDTLMILARDGVREITSTDYPDTPFELGPPLSEPMQPYIDRINWSSASKAVLQKYRHYLFVSVPIDSATENNYTLVWNGKTRSWMGAWTGWNVRAMCTSRFAAQGDRLCIADKEWYDTHSTMSENVYFWLDYGAQTARATFQDIGAISESEFDAGHTPREIGMTARGRSWDFGTQRNWKDGAAAEWQFVNSQGNVELVAVYDEIERQIWLESLGSSTGLVLPFTLPATLGEVGALRAKIITKSLDDLGEFKEMYLEIRSRAGRCELKSHAAEAFVNTIDTE